MPKAKKKPTTYNDIVFDSKDELNFYYWCEEALKIGLINSFQYKPDTIEIIGKKNYKKPFVYKMSGKIQIREYHLLDAVSYSPDFKVVFNKKILDIMKENKLNLFLIDGIHFFMKDDLDEFEILLDVKSSVGNKFGNNSSAVTFPIKQKVLYHYYGIYINKVICKTFFKKTFCPLNIYYNKRSKALKVNKIGIGCKLSGEI